MANTIKVMIVDDEVLAIQHLLHLIPWAEYGFEIVAETTYPQQALELFRKHRPQIIFADIRMPGMDGLAFSKAILQMNAPVHIVLLTSYKEFEYAKEAVKIGVCDYLLKHELHPEELVAVLQRIRETLKENEQKEALIRRQLFQDLLKGLELTWEQTRLLSQEGGRHGNPFLFLLLAANAALPVFPVQPTEEARPEPFGWNEIPADDGFRCLDMLPIGRQQWGAILTVPKTSGYLQARSETMAIARLFQKAFQAQRGISASVAISPLFPELTELHRVYAGCDRILQYAPFFENGSIIEPEVVPVKAADLREDVQPYVTRTAAQLERHEAEQACLTVQEAFTHLIKRFQLEEAMLLCRELVAMLDSFRLKRRLARLAERSAAERERSNWTTFNRISQWFQHMLRETIREADAMQSSRYSWKVRQTLERIRENYKEALTVESLAEEVGISGDRLRHLFKQETGVTVLDYITQVRMEHAKQMLQDKRIKVYEIADQVGYKNSQYFSQVFRKTVGVNPLVYAEGKRAADEMEN
ncbi:response regulator [Paenibacillus piri]|uniref:Response regulator n=1 Tax=Paenibacillus piri TaxID=2547395 RepID=A0A4R5KKZ3_9BACL|nr:response regulator [Paenibacillus piri]TDF96233.1 response regulator [Paenibacillus piri]